MIIFSCINVYFLETKSPFFLRTYFDYPNICPAANELLDLKNFSPGVHGDNYTITFPQHPCVILNALEVLGFRVISSAPKTGGRFPNQVSIL
jgi:hypothetical protein